MASKFNTAANPATTTAAPRTKKRATVAAEPEAVKPVTAYERFMSAVDELYEDAQIPSRTRLVVSYVAAFAAYVVPCYWAVVAAEALVVGALVLTGSTFIAFVAAVLMWIVAFYVAAVAARTTFEFCINFDRRMVDEPVRSVAAKVRGWLTKRSTTQPSVA